MLGALLHERLVARAIETSCAALGSLTASPSPRIHGANQVFVPLIAHCVRPQVSEDRPGGHPGLGLQSAKALQSLAEGEHAGTNAALAALLTPGGLAVLRRSPEEFVRVLRSPVLLETPKLVWGPKCREELEALLKQVGAPQGIYMYCMCVVVFSHISSLFSSSTSMGARGYKNRAPVYDSVKG